MSVISLEKVTKIYAKSYVVNNLSLEIPQGAVYGFIGPNGAGKSTTMKMILGLVSPSSGSISIFGEKMTKQNRGNFISSIGGMIEEPSGYGHLTATENLQIVQSLLGFPAENINWALNIVGLDDARDKKVSAFSLGMKQRLGIALAICRRPSLLILDEPTNGLDPYGIEEIRQLIRRLAKQEGVTVMISSHVLAELEKISSHFAIINKGSIVFHGERSKLIAQHSPSIFIRTDDIERSLLAIDNAERAYGGIEIPKVPDSSIPGLCQKLLDANIPFYEISRPHQSLESIFMEMTKG